MVQRGKNETMEESSFFQGVHERGNREARVPSALFLGCSVSGAHEHWSRCVFVQWTFAVAQRPVVRREFAKHPTAIIFTPPVLNRPPRTPRPPHHTSTTSSTSCLHTGQSSGSIPCAPALPACCAASQAAWCLVTNSSAHE